jgi:hypothetical protein
VFAEKNLGSFGDVLAVEAGSELAEQLIVGQRVKLKNQDSAVDSFEGRWQRWFLLVSGVGLFLGALRERYVRGYHR